MQVNAVQLRTSADQSTSGAAMPGAPGRAAGCQEDQRALQNADDECYTRSHPLRHCAVCDGLQLRLCVARTALLQALLPPPPQRALRASTQRVLTLSPPAPPVRVVRCDCTSSAAGKKRGLQKSGEKTGTNASEGACVASPPRRARPRALSLLPTRAHSRDPSLRCPRRCPHRSSVPQARSPTSWSRCGGAAF